MKQTLIGLIVVVVLLGGGYYLYTKQAAKMTSTTNIDTATTTVATTTPVTVTDATYNLDSLKSVANWEGRKVVLTSWIDQGTIKLASGTVAVIGGKITDTKLAFDMNSIVATANGKNGQFDSLAKHLKSDDFFSAQKYPTSTFVATGLSLDPTVAAEQTVSGKLTVRGVTKDITVPVKLMVDGDSLVVSGSTTVDRTQFNVKYGSGKFFKNLGDNVISDNFTLSFKIYFNR